MSDLISRQDFDKCLEDAEKESVKNRKYVFASALNTIRGNLRNFPSAQPESTIGQLNTDAQSTKMDLISRQAAIDTFHVLAPGIPWKTLDKIFAEIPSADVVSRSQLIETINHYAQYPDGIHKLLAVYAERRNDE